MSNMDLEELIATRVMNEMDDGMYEDERLKEYVDMFNDLENNKDAIGTIDKNFFFSIVEKILRDYERSLKREKKKIICLTRKEKEDLIEFADLLRPEQRYYTNLIKKVVNMTNGRYE